MLPTPLKRTLTSPLSKMDMDRWMGWVQLTENLADNKTHKMHIQYGITDIYVINIYSETEMPFLRKCRH